MIRAPRTERALIARNAATSYGSRVVLGLSALLLTPYLFRTLGVGGFGTWSVIFTVATIFGLLELGFASGVTKFVAEFLAQGRRKDADETIGAAAMLMGVLGLLPAALALALAFFAPGLAAAGEEDAFKTGMILVALARLLRFPCFAYAAALMGHQRYDLVNLVNVVGAAAFPLGAVAAVESGTGVAGVGGAYAASMVLEGALFAFFLRLVDREATLLPRVPHRAVRHRLAGFSSFVMLADAMNFVGARMDVLVVAAIRNAATAAPFAAAVKLQTAVQSLTLPFVKLLMPMASDLWARGERAEVVRRMTIATRTALQITLPAAFALALFSRDVVDVWLGPSAPSITAAIIAVLVSVQAVTMTAAPAEKVLVGLGRVRVIGGLAVLEGVANVAVSATLVYFYGAIGAALGTLFTSALLAPIRFPLVCRATGAPLALFLRSSVGPAVASSLPALTAMIAVWALVPAGAARLAAGLAVGALAAGAVALRQLGLRRAVILATGRSDAEPALSTAGSGELVSEIPRKAPRGLS